MLSKRVIKVVVAESTLFDVPIRVITLGELVFCSFCFPLLLAVLMALGDP